LTKNLKKEFQDLFHLYLERRIIKGKLRITANTALRLSKYFGNTAKFWLGIQDDYDIEEEQFIKHNELKSINRLNTESIA